MAREKKHQFRVGKIEIIKSVARRPKGLFRPDKIHRDETAYSRRKAKAALRKAIRSEE
jgi:hypothetical protein